MKILGAVIAGGKSSRMGGREKALLAFGQQPLIGQIIVRLRPQVDGLIINANGDPARFVSFGCDVVGDETGLPPLPLTGVLAALDYAAAAGYEAVLTMTSDTPFVPDDYCARLRNSMPAIAASGGQAHYLCGLWPTDLTPLLRQMLSSTEFVSARNFVRAVGATVVEWPILPYDPFMNINRPEDLAMAQEIAERG